MHMLTPSRLSPRLRVCKEVGGADAAVNYREKDWQQQVKGGFVRLDDEVSAHDCSLLCLQT